MILGLSRTVFFAGLIATAGAAGGLWYVMSEDERSAPVAQRESVATQEAARSQPGVQAPADQTAQVEAEPEEAGQAPSDDAVSGTQATDETAAQATRDGIEDVAQDALAESDADTAQVETLIEEDVAALGDPAAPAPKAEPEIALPRLPAFDTIRVEPTGEAVIAGRDAPEGDVALLRDGEVYDETFAGPSGAFVFIPRPFPTGTSDVTLRATDAQGNVLTSRESVTIIVDAERARMPMVALTAPGRPTEVLSRPEPVQVAEIAAQETTSSEAPADVRATRDAVEPDDVAGSPEDINASGADVAQQTLREPGAAETAMPESDAMPTDETETAVAAIDPDADNTAQPVGARPGVRIVAVEAETGGGLFVSGEAEAQAAIRLYLNDTLVARAEADEEGDVSFAIRRGVRPGRYQVRLDDVDPETGTVRSRAEVAFTVPEAVSAALPEPEPAPSAEAGAPTPPAAQATEAEQAGSPPTASEATASEATEAEATEAALTEAQDSAAREPQRQAESADASLGTTAEAESSPEAPATVGERREATVVVPELSTASVERGDSLWRISRQVYGRGIRYTEIFEANQDQIRNPDLIYPGQVFVLPPDAEAGQDGQEAQPPAAR